MLEAAAGEEASLVGFDDGEWRPRPPPGELMESPDVLIGSDVIGLIPASSILEEYPEIIINFVKLYYINHKPLRFNLQCILYTRIKLHNKLSCC